MTRRLLLLALVAGLAAGELVWRARPGPAASPRVPTARSVAQRSAAASDNLPAVARATAVAGVLFTFVHPADAAELDAALPAPSREIHYVRLNQALMAGKQSPFWQKPGAGRLLLPLPDGSVLPLAIEESTMLGAERWTSIGRVAGAPGSRAVLAYCQGFLHATIEDPARGRFALRAATSDLAQFYQVDPALVPGCGGERRPPVRPAPARAADGGNPAPATPGAANAALTNPQPAEIGVMFVYTQAVLPTLSGAARTAALQSAFDAAIATANADFAASFITARVKLVALAETQYDETKSAANRVQDDALTALQNDHDGRMDEIHALRDAAGADIVCLALGRPDFGSSGLSFLLDTPGSLDNPSYAFSVVQYDTVAGTNVVPHEFGHVLGCAHDRENAFSGPGAYAYSYGYRFFGADGRQYHDIMAYPPGSELSYFSNPAINVPAPVAAPIGIAPGRPGESDTALTIEQNAFAVSEFRLQPAAAGAGAGNLIQVATRAWVGAGDQVLIGGFVIAGTQPKRVLLRAAGPALRAFGVGDALSDPRLRVYRGAAVVAANEDWSTDGETDLATAAASAGAFPFATGSADAGLVVTLPPGGYAAVVEGAAAATGTALLEGYELERDGGRFINLATRGFADRTRPLIGTFTIGLPAATGAGTPPTKRVLIRALGPTLGRAPFNLSAPLDDPILELRNAAGSLLIRNDDWSRTSQFTLGVADDFHPLVTNYTEQQIAATGLAPTNRREPCILVDLPPGAYSVVVQPFEDLAATPVTPAQPGVGLIEVYEIR